MYDEIPEYIDPKTCRWSFSWLINFSFFLCELRNCFDVRPPYKMCDLQQYEGKMRVCAMKLLLKKKLVIDDDVCVCVNSGDIFRF